MPKELMSVEWRMWLLVAFWAVVSCTCSVVVLVDIATFQSYDIQNGSLLARIQLALVVSIRNPDVVVDRSVPLQMALILGAARRNVCMQRDCDLSSRTLHDTVGSVVKYLSSPKTT